MQIILVSCPGRRLGSCGNNEVGFIGAETALVWENTIACELGEEVTPNNGSNYSQIKTLDFITKAEASILEKKTNFGVELPFFQQLFVHEQCLRKTNI